VPVQTRRGNGCDGGYAERPPPWRAAASPLSRSALSGRRSPEFCQKSAPGFWFEAQHGPCCRLAVADANAATCEAGSLDTLPIAHAVRTLPPAPAGITLIRIVPCWGSIAHLRPFGPIAKKLYLFVTIRSPHREWHSYALFHTCLEVVKIRSRLSSGERDSSARWSKASLNW